jgi:hypothetical protein
MRRLLLALGLCAPTLMLGANVTVNNADLLYLEGPAQVAVTTGTVVESTLDDEEGVWKLLFSRNAGQSGIVLDVPPGTYQAIVWSIPADPANPYRQQTTTTIQVGDTAPQVGATQLLAMLNTWGPCSGGCAWDLNGDGLVDAFDLLILLGLWGQPLP